MSDDSSTNLPSPFGRGAGGEGSESTQSQNAISPPDALTLTLSQRERGPAWLKGRERTLLLAGITIQLLVLVGMIMLRTVTLMTGETVLLRIVPVDPRDLFRGDYVTLSYEFSRIPPQGIAGLPTRQHDRYGSRDDDWEGQTVYVSLVPEEDGKHYRADRYSIDPPTDGLYLRGTITNWDRIEYGIDSYYVEEGTGRKYEDAARTRQLSAEVAIDSDGKAVLRGLHIDAEPATDSPTPPAEKPVWNYSPSSATYRVCYLPQAKIELDGKADDADWSRANVERQFRFPWKKDAVAPPTEFRALCDDTYLYFTFQAEDADIFVLDTLRDKQDVIFEDRVEMFFSRDSQMSKYFCFEIDPRGRTYDYQGSYYRKFDPEWSCPGLETKASPTANGYIVEGRIPLTSFVEMGFPLLRPGTRILCGLYRAEFSHDRSGKPVEQKETLHNAGRKLDGPPPIEEWISWIDPKTPEPDFHVPSSFGWLEIVE